MRDLADRDHSLLTDGLAETLYVEALRRNAAVAENGGSRRRDVEATIAPQRKPGGLARELRRLDNDGGGGRASAAGAIAGMGRSQVAQYVQ